VLFGGVSVFNGGLPIFFSEFLNVDDDEMGGNDDDGIPGPEDVRLLDNSGWSSRTRCVWIMWAGFLLDDMETEFCLCVHVCVSVWWCAFI